MLLKDKKILIAGMLTKESIGYGIAKSLHAQGAELAFSYEKDSFAPRVRFLAKEFGSDFVFRLDVMNQDDLLAAKEQMEDRWGRLDGIVHSIGMMNKMLVDTDIVEVFKKNDIRAIEAAMNASFNVNILSLPNMVTSFLSLLEKSEGASVLALTSPGADRIIPTYHFGGMQKAALSACIRYLAEALGPKNIRVNGISVFIINSTRFSFVDAKVFPLFQKTLEFSKQNLLEKEVTVDHIGNEAAFLMSDLSSMTTGKIIDLDGGLKDKGVF